MAWHRFEWQQNHYKYCRMIFNEIFIQHARHKLPLFFCFCSIQNYCEVYMCTCLCLIFLLMLCMLGKNFSRRYFEIYFLFLPENRLWHLIKIVSLHEMSEPVFWEKYYHFVVCWICPKSSESWYWTAIYSSVTEFARRVVKVDIERQYIPQLQLVKCFIWAMVRKPRFSICG